MAAVVPSLKLRTHARAACVASNAPAFGALPATAYWLAAGVIIAS